MQPGNPVKPSQVGSYRYHMMFDSMDSAWKLINLFAPSDNPVVVTTHTRPNMYLIYDPTSPLDDSRKWVDWKYNEYIHVENGYYGTNYFIFGNGKVFHEIPNLID